MYEYLPYVARQFEAPKTTESMRYGVYDKETGLLIDDAQGYGYKTKDLSFAHLNKQPTQISSV